MESIRTVLFDLDGTLADTAPDLKRAADHVLKDLGRRALTAEEAYRTAPLGMAAMLKASLGSESVTLSPSETIWYPSEP